MNADGRGWETEDVGCPERSGSPMDERSAASGDPTIYRGYSGNHRSFWETRTLIEAEENQETDRESEKR